MTLLQARLPLALVDVEVGVSEDAAPVLLTCLPLAVVNAAIGVSHDAAPLPLPRLIVLPLVDVGIGGQRGGDGEPEPLGGPPRLLQRDCLDRLPVLQLPGLPPVCEPHDAFADEIATMVGVRVNVAAGKPENALPLHHIRLPLAIEDVAVGGPVNASPISQARLPLALVGVAGSVSHDAAAFGQTCFVLTLVDIVCAA